MCMLSIQLVESIPDGLNYSENAVKFMSTFDAWKQLLDIANDSLDIGSFYWTLRGADVVDHPTAAQGEEIFNKILSNGLEKKTKIRIAQSYPTAREPDMDTKIFEQQGAATIRSVNFPRLIGNGVLHTKMWIVDNKHFYLGSANMDWRALTQVKELGVLAQNCECLTQDIAKIFEAYWYLGLDTSTIPQAWPSNFSTQYNLSHPIQINFNKKYSMSAYLSSSPAPFNANGREHDLTSILTIIATAKSFVNIAVMDYFPLTLYTEKVKYWPYIDNALRTAAIENNITIRMLISWWPHSRPEEDHFLKSLQTLSSTADRINIQIRRFVVPSNTDQKKIPYSRVNHNKYMVTDNTAYIGTSNWSGDYFIDTAGIGLAIRDSNTSSKTNTLRTDLVSVFERDWESPYAVELA